MSRSPLHWLGCFGCRFDKVRSPCVGLVARAVCAHPLADVCRPLFPNCCLPRAAACPSQVASAPGALSRWDMCRSTSLIHSHSQGCCRRRLSCVQQVLAWQVHEDGIHDADLCRAFLKISPPLCMCMWVDHWCAAAANGLQTTAYHRHRECCHVADRLDAAAGYAGHPTAVCAFGVAWPPGRLPP